MEVLEYGFMQRALLSGVLVGVACSFMGSFLVLRRYALFGDGIAHVAFGGVAVGLFAGVFPLWTAFIAAVAGGIGLQKLRSWTGISGDSAVAVVLVTGLAVGVILVSAAGGFSVDLFGFLFGSILLVGVQDTVIILAACAGVITTLLLLRRQFMHIAFSEEQARVSGLNVTALNYLFVAMAAVTVVASMRLVGILLISALVVLPNIAAMSLGLGFARTVLASVVISAFSVVMGVMLSYYLDLAPAGTIVMTAVAVMGCVLAFSRLR